MGVGVLGLVMSHRPYDPLVRLSWRTVIKPSGCWEWLGSRTDCGYGRLWVFSSKKTLAHRLSYDLLVGDIPESTLVLHHCDNPPCWNPNHLFLGTQKDNMADMFLNTTTLKMNKSESLNTLNTNGL